MKRKILIDATTVTSQVDGLSHYIINLIKYLPAQSFEKFDYTVVINKGLQRKALTDILHNSPIAVIEAKIAPIGPKRDWDMYWFLRKYETQFDVIHITNNNYPFALKNGICTITDITFKQYFDNPKFTFNLAQLYMDKVIRHALKNSRAIIAISQATKNDLCKTYKLPPTIQDKIYPIHLGWEHIKNEIESEAKQCTQQLEITQDYLLYVGTFRIHKNMARLLQAFRSALNRLPKSKKLVVIGSDKYLKASDQEVINDINADGKRVVFTGYLSQACVDRYFSNADAYIFPSFSEGFGLGVLEAFYYKIPLLCSNTTSLPEIAGDAALYFNPYNHEDIADAIVRFYEDESIATSLIERGKERLTHFSWCKNATQTVDLYGKVLDKSSR